MPYAKALIPAALLLVGFLAGWSWTSARWTADVAEIRLDIAEHRLNASLDRQAIERLQVVADNALSEAAAAAAVEHEARVQYVTKEVVKYVESHDAGKCSASDAWVRAYNAGWDSGLPSAKDTPSVGDGASAGVRGHAGTLDGRAAAAGGDAKQPEPPKNPRDVAGSAAVGQGDSQ